MLSIFIPAVLLQVFLYRLGTEDNGSEPHPWQGEFLIAVAIVSGLMVGVLEFLSLLTAITQLWMSLIWGLVFLIILIAGIKTSRYKIAFHRLKLGFSSWRPIDYILLGIITLLVSLVFAVAISAPSNNVDSMKYHIPRVLHWVQNQSLRHFPSAHFSQNGRPFFAEGTALVLRILAGTDRVLNLVQWFSMIAAVIGATGIVSLFGGKRSVQWLTAAFVVSIPMGILQSSTMQNDYVSTLWAVCLAYFIVLSMKRELRKIEFVGLALALGLGMLTKGTFFPYAFALCAWFMFSRLRKVGILRAVIEGVLLVVVVSLINSGFWYRNMLTYGGPYGSRIPVRLLPQLSQTGKEEGIAVAPSNPTPAPDLADSESTTIGSVVGSNGDAGRGLLSAILSSISEKLSRLVRMLAMNLVTPVYIINRWVFSAFENMPGIFDSEFIQSLENAAWNHEDTAGSPLHLFLIILSLPIVLYYRIKGKARIVAQYSMAAVLGLFLVTLIQYSDLIYSIRYQLTFLVLGGPIVGYIGMKGNNKFLVYGATIVFLILALPYVFFSNMRPIIGRPPWPTRVNSVFTADPNEILFAIVPEFRDEYEHVVKEVEEIGCSQVGLSLPAGALEYTFWRLLEAPRSDIRIEVTHPREELKVYRVENFKPCAIICTRCQNDESLLGLELRSDYGHIQLFSGSDFNGESDG